MKILIIILILILFILFFNRSPSRKSILNDNIIVSPCDGTVTFAEKNKISVFLSPLDVHVQYTPISSYISDMKIVNKNNFKLANTPESSHNEGVRVVFKSKLGDIIVTQRVGFFVRRIINNIKVNEYKKRSTKYGFITFGSRCDIELPSNMITCLKKGDYLTGGETRII
jgi:phosphatidylserine decarboxylase